MPVATKYAATGQAAGGVYNGSWTNPTNVASDNGIYATAAPGKNQEYASVFPIAFTTGEVPAGATVNSALVEIQVKCSTTSSIGVVTSSLFADSAQATAIGAVPGVQTPTTEPLADTTYQYTRNPTLAQVRDLWVRVQGTRGNSNTALTWSLDFVRVTIDYTDPPAAVTGTGAGTSAASSGTGAASEAFIGSGGGTAALSAGSGSGIERFIASGAGIVATSSGSGTGSITLAGFSGTGAGTSAASSGSGEAVLSYIASGAGTSAASTANGSAALIFAAVGAGIGAASTSAGNGLLRFLAEGAATSSASSGSGSGTSASTGVVGSGNGTSAASSGSGTGTIETTGQTYPYTEHGCTHYGPDGPWETHGVMHYGHHPFNH